MVDHDMLCARAEALLPGWRRRAGVTELARRLPAETVAELHEAGLLRIVAPRRYGGLELGWPTLVETSRIAARACASTGWMISLVGGHMAIVARLPLVCQERIFAAGPLQVLATASTPTTGTIVKEEGGFRLHGVWRFASGIDYATWVMVAGPCCYGPGWPEPAIVKIIVRADQVNVEDNWYVSGMRGTGSKDVRFEDLFVPDEGSIAKSECLGAHPPGATAHPGAYLYELPLLPYCTTWVIGPILGSAEGAFEDYVVATQQRIATAPAAMQTVLPLVQERLAESAAELACAHHLYASICTTLHGAGLARCPISLSELAVLKRDSAYMVQLCVRAVQLLVGQLGASATLDANPVQRQWRDLQVMATHIDVNRDRAMAAYASEILGCANLRMQVAAARC